MKKLIACFLLLSGHCLAQERYSPGLIVTNANDTTRGFIREGTDTDLRKQIEFKTANDASATVYNSSQLTAFKFDYGREFRRFGNGKNGTDEEQQLFAKKLVEGRVKIFSTGPTAYALYKGDTAYRISSPFTRDIKTGSKIYRANDPYIVSTINSLLRDTRVALPDLARVRVNEKVIKNMVLKYNQGFSQTYPVSEYKEKVKLNYRLTYGFSTNMVNSQKQYQVGLFIEQTKVEKSLMISIMSGLVFNSWDSGIVGPGQETGTIFLKQNSIELYPISFNLQFKPALFQPFVHADVGLLSRSNTDCMDVRYDTVKGEYVVDSTFKKAETRFLFVALGVGTKINIGEHGLLVEVNSRFGSAIVNPNSLYVTAGAFF